ncbi:histone transcription regulator (HIR1)-like WD40 repeat protein [Cryptosporidium canis]|nr:histone transcription regulator (HIR1)-like WD40 repeat protein [Cryptosporidium canis]
MRVEKIKEIKAPGDGILSVSFQPHPIDERWDIERVAICGEKGVYIWSFEYSGNHKKLAFIESSTCSLIKMCRWSQDGKFLAIVDMEQIAVYYKGAGSCSGTPRNLSGGAFGGEEEDDGDSDEIFENWTLYASFSSSDVNECADICWLSGSKVLINGTISGHFIVYNMEERCQSSNLFIRDILEASMRNKNLPVGHLEIGHVSGLCSDTRGLFLASQMSTRRLLIFNVEYNNDHGTTSLPKRNCITLTFLLEEERLIINSPCILTFIRRPVFDPLTCLIGCPYGEVGTSYFSCLFPFRDISDSKPFGWEDLCRLVNYKSEQGDEDMSDIWNLHNEGKTSIKSRLELPEAFRLRGHQRRVRMFQFSSTVIKEKNELFSLCAQSSQDGSLSFWKVIYDLDLKSKIKSIECFLVLTNFMDEQASVTDISFNNLNNSVLIGSDDNKLTLVSFELEEFSLAKVASKGSPDFYSSSWNYWSFDYKPEMPVPLSSKTEASAEESSLFSKHISLPTVTANEIREHQERTQEAVISSKGTKIRRIQPMNLTEIYNSQAEDKNEHISQKTASNADSGVSEDKSQSRDVHSNVEMNGKNPPGGHEHGECSLPEAKEGHTAKKQQSEESERDAGHERESSTQSVRGADAKVTHSSDKEWMDSLVIPPRLAIETKAIMDQKSFKIAIFADNRQVIENLSRKRASSTEIICMRQESEAANASKEMLWYKPVSCNNVVTHMIRIKDLLLVISSDVLERRARTANSSLDFLSLNTGATVVGGISLPFVLKVVISESLDMILLVTAIGRIKVFQISGKLHDFGSSAAFSQTVSTHPSSGFSIDSVLDTDWSFLSGRNLIRVDLFSSRGTSPLQDRPDDPIILLYFEDGVVFCYSFSISSFVRIDDLEHSRSDFWSLAFPKTYMQILNSNNRLARARLLEQVSESVSAECQESEIELSSVCLDPRWGLDTDPQLQTRRCFFLREIQQNSRHILLAHQHSQETEQLFQNRLLSIFESIFVASVPEAQPPEGRPFGGEDRPECSQTEMTDHPEGPKEAPVQTEPISTPDGLSAVSDPSPGDQREGQGGQTGPPSRDFGGNIRDTRMHIEHQLVSSIVVKSKPEFKYWFRLYVKFSLDSLDLDCINEIVSRVLALVREDILGDGHPAPAKSAGLARGYYQALSQGQGQSQSLGQTQTQTQRPRGLAAPVWFSPQIMESIDVDPAQLLVECVIREIDDFGDISQSYAACPLGGPLEAQRRRLRIEQFRDELAKTRERMVSQIKSIQEDFCAYKSRLLSSSQCLNPSQDSETDYSSRLEILDSIFD